ncbi:heavy-metal-associated domain-containing protein [Nocardia australiensis]|uniref:heavy-metal-associated domain-containing protein n=1 Tax=Nocardia australiensis TaxID=2887191 RepID=UPI001D13C868|nr:heavy metal-associated domain-containing protein [Nocardia australiensis]
MAEEVYRVTGMTCGHCAQHVTSEVQKLPGVTGVDVDVERGRVTVRSDAGLPTADVRAAVENAGYDMVDA